MAHFVGLDESVEETAVCVVDKAGEVICEHNGGWVCWPKGDYPLL